LFYNGFSVVCLCTLTTGADSFAGTAGADTINAVYDTTAANSTVTAFDAVDGGAGTDTLKITSTDTYTAGDLAALGVSFSNIENLIVSGTGDIELDETDITGFTNVTANATSGDVTLDSDTATSITVNGGAAVALTDVSTDADVLNSVTVDGASSTVSVTGDAVTTVSLSDISAAGGYDITATAGTRTLTASVDGVIQGAGGAVDFDDVTATSVVLNATGSASHLEVEFDAATSLTVNAAADLEVIAGDITALTNLTVTGAGDFTSDVSGGAALTTVSAGTSTGAVDVTIAATATAVTTGAGDDAVTQAAALGATQVINTGAGDDTVSLVAASALTAGATVNGGAGDDALILDDEVVSGATANTQEAVISNFEEIKIATTLQENVNMANLDDIQKLTFMGDTEAQTVSGLNSGATLGFEATTTAKVTATVTNALTGTADELNVVLTATAAKTNAGIVVANIEKLNITATDSDDDTTDADITHTITAIDSITDLTTVVIGGSAGLDITSPLTAVTSVNASANTVGVTVDFTGNDEDITFTGGEGDDTIDATGDGDNTLTLGNGANTVTDTGDGDNTITGGDDIDTITVGDGANTVNAGADDDVIELGNGANTVNAGEGDDDITFGTGLNVITGGAGVDTFTMSTTNTNANTYTTIRDLGDGETIVFATPGASAVFTADAITLADTAAFNDFLEAAAAGAGDTDGGIVSWFQFAGNTFIVNDNSDSTTFDAGTDEIVKLTGLVDLSDSAFGAADGTFTYTAV
jgi:hypothetical protein